MGKPFLYLKKHKNVTNNGWADLTNNLSEGFTQIIFTAWVDSYKVLAYFNNAVEEKPTKSKTKVTSGKNLCPHLSGFLLNPTMHQILLLQNGTKINLALMKRLFTKF